MELIRLENICKTYHLGEVDVPVLRGVSLTINKGEMVALMGASGSGKSTLMNILGCLDRPSSGKYWLDGQEMSKLSPNERAMVRTEKLGFVFQNFNLLARTTAIQNVVMPLDYSPDRQPERRTRGKGLQLLHLVGLGDRIDHTPSQMSGGQQQRVAISRSLVNSPALLLADEPTGNLDSHTSIEILQMFQKLNAEGITVLLVTHDPNVAKYAHRTIRIVDGMIETSENPAPEKPVLEALASDRAQPLANASCSVSSGPENLTEKVYAEKPSLGRTLASLLPVTFRTAFRALRRNKMRSILSALGVIIAVAAVIAMTEIGQGSKELLRKNIASMGANTIMVLSGAMSRGGVSQGTGTAITLTPQDAEEIARQCPAVKSVAPMIRTRVQVVYGNRNCVPESINGTTPIYLDVGEWKIASGEMFTDRDVLNSNKVCVIGSTIKKELFPSGSPIGKDIRINNITFRVVGLLERKGANMMGMDQDNIVFAPWTTVKYRISASTLTNTNQSASAASESSSTSEAINSLSALYPGSTSLYLARTAMQNSDTPQPVRFTNIDIIVAKAVSGAKVEKAVEQITELLRDRHRIKPEAEDDFEIRTMAELTKIISSSTQLMSTLLLVVAMISLLVGGVGIMNIMLVSVTERTREIGLRMAVGARSYHILRQFLVEAVVLCLAGGAIGVLLGRGASLLVRIFAKWPVQASFEMILAAVAVSVAVGVIFGFYPAWKASRLDPIEALRYE